MVYIFIIISGLYYVFFLYSLSKLIYIIILFVKEKAYFYNQINLVFVHDKTNDNVYDLIVIGTGVAASTVAWKCHSAGWKIAIIDSRPFGGTCNLRGCDPKKVLVGQQRSLIGTIEWAIKALTILKIFISNGQN